MLGHGSAITTAYNVTCLPALGATNSGFPKFVSTVRLSEDDIDTDDISEEKKKERRQKLSYSYHVIVCVRQWVEMNGRGKRKVQGKAEGGRGRWSGMVECPYLVLELVGPMSAEFYRPHCLQSTGTCQCAPLLDWRC